MRPRKHGAAESEEVEQDSSLTMGLPYICVFDMLRHMRTTLNIDSEIMMLVKKRAAESGRTITEIVEQALRKEMSGQPPRTNRFIFRWSPIAGKAQPGIDLADRDSLYGAMERGE